MINSTPPIFSRIFSSVLSGREIHPLSTSLSCQVREAFLEKSDFTCAGGSRCVIDQPLLCVGRESMQGFFIDCSNIHAYIMLYIISRMP